MFNETDESQEATHEIGYVVAEVEYFARLSDDHEDSDIIRGLAKSVLREMEEMSRASYLARRHLWKAAKAVHGLLAVVASDFDEDSLEGALGAIMRLHSKTPALDEEVMA